MKGKEANTYDAIVVGTGISGGWAAMELCRAGLKTLVLERGRHVAHGDYPTASLDTWDLPLRDKLPAREKREHYPKLSRKDYITKQATKHRFVKDDEYPYTEKRRFDWIRGYHTGGRSLMWGGSVTASATWISRPMPATASPSTGPSATPNSPPGTTTYPDSSA